LQIKVNTHYVQ